MAALLEGSDITANSQSTLSHRCQTADLASSGWQKASACFCLSLYPGLYSHGGLLWQELKMTAVCTCAWESLCIQVGSCLMVTVLKSGWPQAAIPWHRLEYVSRVMRIPDQRNRVLFLIITAFFFILQNLSVKVRKGQDVWCWIQVITLRAAHFLLKKYWVHFKNISLAFSNDVST